MITKIFAKSAVDGPRMLIIGQKPVYTVDRRQGYRLTVVNRNDLEQIYNGSFNDAKSMSMVLQEYDRPPYITMVVGHGPGKVYIRIKDNGNGMVVKKVASSGSVSAKYFLWRKDNTETDNIMPPQTSEYQQAQQQAPSSQITGPESPGMGISRILKLAPIVGIAILVAMEWHKNND